MLAQTWNNIPIELVPGVVIDPWRGNSAGDGPTSSREAPPSAVSDAEDVILPRFPGDGGMGVPLRCDAAERRGDTVSEVSVKSGEDHDPVPRDENLGRCTQCQSSINGTEFAGRRWRFNLAFEGRDQ